jgi:hypothetical protein
MIHSIVGGENKITYHNRTRCTTTPETENCTGGPGTRHPGAFTFISGEADSTDFRMYLLSCLDAAISCSGNIHVSVGWPCSYKTENRVTVAALNTDSC